ncbi:hypothetical protein BY996DRAFT_6500068 [Phakopsora pachyrhizi]|nr:hypothetical protein BY996DRAFT_6500068 [Phakopsora pachyrhizi]
MTGKCCPSKRLDKPSPASSCRPVWLFALTALPGKLAGYGWNRAGQGRVGWLAKEGHRGFCWILLGFEEEGVVVEIKEWCHWKEEQKLGGGAHQGQSGWSKTTGATDL